jgi:2-methylisocitrate lyase-like PEP mutase family enzyme
MKSKTQLKNILRTNKITVAPGIYDGLSARLAEQAGFDCIYASGGAIARSMGVPDIGLLTLTDIVIRLREITSVVNIPVIADADTGYGNEVNVRKTIEMFEQVGVAGLHLEDQEFPKRCGHLDGKALITIEEMCIKIKAACRAISNPDFLLIARTDAIAVEGFDKALERAKAYIQAGAQMIFVEAPTSIEQIEAIAEAVPGPKLINMFSGGKTPLVPKEKLQELGYQLIIIPSDLQRAAIKAMQNTLSVISKHGDSASIEKEMVSFKDRERIVDTESYFKN